MDYFKERIAKEIEENDKAIELFIECSHRISKIIELLQTPSDLSNESSDMKKLLKIIGNNSISKSMMMSSED